MREDIKLGSLFTWTLQSPKESGKIVDEFYAFIDDRLDQLEVFLLLTIMQDAIRKYNEIVK